MPAAETLLETLRIKWRRDEEQYLYEFTLPRSNWSRTSAAEISYAVPVSSRARLESELLNMATWLRNQVGADPSASAASASGDTQFAALGKLITRTMLPPQVEEYLASSTTPLLISTNDPAFPWHLAWVAGEHLGIRRPLGIEVLIPQRVPREMQPRLAPVPTTRRALLISNPTGDRPETREEAKKVRALLETWNRALKVDDLYGEQARVMSVSAALSSDYDLIHYTGHAQFEFQSGGHRALTLADGELPLRQIHRLAGSAAFVFINACWGGATVLTYSPDSSDNLFPSGRQEGIAIEFIKAGTQSVLAPIWPVFDGRSRLFATWFYEEATKNLPLGEVIRQVRVRSRSEQRGDPTWGVYAFYGDPTHTLADELAQRSASRAGSNQATPPSFPVVQPPTQSARPLSAKNGEPPADAAPPPPSPSRRAILAEKLRERFLKGREAMTFASDAVVLFEQAILFIWQDQREGIHTLDLLVAMTRVPGLPVAASLKSLGVKPRHLTQIAQEVFEDERVEGLPDGYGFSTRTKEVIARAAELAEQAQRQEVTALDLVVALLTEPTNSIGAVLKHLRVDPSALLEAVRGVMAGEGPGSNQAGAGVPTMLDDEEPIIAPLPGKENRFLVDLLARARQGNTRFFWGRENLLRQLVRTLAQRVNPSVLLVGRPGAGKWALVEALARALAEHPAESGLSRLAGFTLIGLDASSAALSEQDLLQCLTQVFHEATSRQQTIVVIRDFPRLLAQLGQHDQKLLSLLREALTSPEVRLILTAADLRGQARWLPHDLTGLLTRIEIPGAAADQARQMLAGHVPWISQQNQVALPPAVVVAAAQENGPLAQPGLGIYLLREAAHRHRLNGAEVGRALPTLLVQETDPQANTRPGVGPLLELTVQEVQELAAELRKNHPPQATGGNDYGS